MLPRLSFFQPGILVHGIVQPKIVQWVFVYQLTQSRKDLTNMPGGLFISMVILTEIQMIINIKYSSSQQKKLWNKMEENQEKERTRKEVSPLFMWIPGVS